MRQAATCNNIVLLKAIIPHASVYLVEIWQRTISFFVATLIGYHLQLLGKNKLKRGGNRKQIFISLNYKWISSDYNKTIKDISVLLYDNFLIFRMIQNIQECKLMISINVLLFLCANEHLASYKGIIPVFLILMILKTSSVAFPLWKRDNVRFKGDLTSYQ